MRQANYTAIATQAGATVSSAAIDAEQIFYGTAQLVATGTEVGTMILQASNDPKSLVGGPVNWSAIPSATIAVASAGVYLIPKTDLCYQWVRVNYTHTSGSGNITVQFNSFGV